MRKNYKDDGKKSMHRGYGLIENLMFSLGRMISADKMLLLFIPIGIVCAPVMRYLWSFLSKCIIDSLMNDTNIAGLFRLILLFALIQLVVTILQSIFSKETAWRFIKLRCQVVKEVALEEMKADYEKLESSDFLDSYKKATNACGGKTGICGMVKVFVELLMSFSVLGTGIVVLRSMNIYISLLMIGVALFNFCTLNYTLRIVKIKIRDPLIPWQRKMSYAHMQTQDIKAAKEIRMYKLKNFFIDKIKGYNNIFLRECNREERVWFTISLLSTVLHFLLQVLVYVWLVFSVMNKRLTIGDFTLYTATAFAFFDCFTNILNYISQLVEASREVNDYREFIDAYCKKKCVRGKSVPKDSKYRFVFENVSFCYPNSEKKAINHLNLKIESGEKIAVVGGNGAGKSTLIKLLLRLYEPTEGRILLNGLNVNEYDLQEYYNIFAPVFQNVELYAFSLAENVSLKESQQEQARRCLIAAGLEEKIKSLPKNVDTEVLRLFYEDGIDLSGGERQKLALARALYKNADVIILDEPTSALDPIAEGELYEKFDKLIEERTAIYISHRLSSTQFCTCVVLLEDGEIAEYGTHKELMERGGMYAEMFNVQAQYYVEESSRGCENIC